MPDVRVLSLPLNPAAIKKNQGFDYIEPSVAVRILDHAFGKDAWSFEIVNQWTNDIGDYNILFNVHGRLTVYFPVADGSGILNLVPRTRDYIATTTFRNIVTASSQGKKLSEIQHADLGKKDAGDSIWKATTTDCFKKCASQFGVALELYGKDATAKAFSFTFTLSQQAKLKDLEERGLKTEALKDELARMAGLGLSFDDVHPYNFDEFYNYADARLPKKTAE